MVNGTTELSDQPHRVVQVIYCQPLTERIRNKERYPLLSCSDIETLLAHFLPRQDTTVNEVINQRHIRHKQRQATIDSAFRKWHQNRQKPSD